jgi:hypothetical protein
MSYKGAYRNYHYPGGDAGRRFNMPKSGAVVISLMASLTLAGCGDSLIPQREPNPTSTPAVPPTLTRTPRTPTPRFTAEAITPSATSTASVGGLSFELIQGEIKKLEQRLNEEGLTAEEKAAIDKTIEGLESAKEYVESLLAPTGTPSPTATISPARLSETQTAIVMTQTAISITQTAMADVAEAPAVTIVLPTDTPRPTTDSIPATATPTGVTVVVPERVWVAETTQLMFRDLGSELPVLAERCAVLFPDYPYINGHDQNYRDVRVRPGYAEGFYAFIGGERMEGMYTPDPDGGTYATVPSSSISDTKPDGCP